MQDDGPANLNSTYRKAFQVPENLNRHSELDFKTAARHCVEHLLRKRTLPGVIPKHPVPQ